MTELSGLRAILTSAELQSLELPPENATPEELHAWWLRINTWHATRIDPA